MAARLVIDELQSIANVRTVNEPEFQRQRELAMQQDAWHSQRVVLARELPFLGWRDVRRVYDSLSMPPRSSAGEREVDEQYERAMNALKPLAKEPRYWWQRLRQRFVGE